MNVHRTVVSFRLRNDIIQIPTNLEGPLFMTCQNDYGQRKLDENFNAMFGETFPIPSIPTEGHLQSNSVVVVMVDGPGTFLQPGYHEIGR